ncbi:response regulator [Pareuzebyella sediminis]|uniref:response regulator n=1 Tax=Pareuzebyella sediminis TaxID=2607998 RepID=UPI0011EEED3B|nr:response regulator [Pareuzebyella sediminis]
MRGNNIQLIALVDDDAEDREIFKGVCNDLDLDLMILCFENGRTLLSYLTMPDSDIPAMLFLDINMPVMNGFEVLQELRSKPTFDDLCVIMYSTSTSDADIMEAKRLGADCFLKKPSNYRRLTEIMQRMLNLDWQNPRSQLGEKNFLIKT